MEHATAGPSPGRPYISSALAGLLIAAAWTAAAAAATPVGEISRIQASAQALTEGAARRLETRTAVNLDDVITTGADARLEITFADGTKVTVGENARFVVDRFLVSSEQNRAQIEFAIEGAFRFVSGMAGKMAARDVSVRTPTAIIGVRGTDFWGGPIDDQSGVFLLEGAVSVTSQEGQVVLDQPGQGTNIAGPAQAPSAASFWRQDKIDRAIATVTFR